jgi:PAS domain S-box-containing protein
MEDITLLKKQIEDLKNEIQELKSDKNSVRVTIKEQLDYQESQTRFRTIFEHSRLGNKIISSDLKILQVNPSMVKLLGFEEKNEIIGTRILDYAPEEFHHDWKTLQTKLWEMSIPSFTLETCLNKKDGSTIWCNVTSILFKDNGETYGYTIIEDVSQQKLLSLEKKQSDIFKVTLNTQEEERRRISESLHNGLGQLLYGAKLSIESLTQKIAVENSRQFQNLKEYAVRLLTDSINDVRRISHELMPSILIDFGLKDAIESLCYQLKGKTHFNCHVTLDGAQLDNFVELAVFRTVQELMLNIIKHAKATESTVNVKVEGIYAIINVRDNGRGMDTSQKDKQGIGLSSIRNKVDLLKGDLIIESLPGKGTSIEVRLPHHIPQ